MVEYESFKEATKALKCSLFNVEMNNEEILGQAVKVEWAFKKPANKNRK